MDSAGQGPATILIVGPTAVGKSALALALAERLPLEVVNADALQVYRGLDIGTAKPSLEEREQVRHHLIDILDPSEPFSAGDFRRLALPVVADIRRRGKCPVVVGGSGFYVRALVEGLSAIPPIPESVREEVRELWRRDGLAAVGKRLLTLDPVSAERIPPEDTQRVLRALEVVISTGRGLADWWSDEPEEGRLEIGCKLGLTLPRALLYDRIDQRVAEMVREGWIEEVRELLRRGCLPTSAAFQAIGYRQVVRHIRGEWPLDRALQDTARETRRFAKRQVTWFRKEQDVHWLDGQFPERALSAASGVILRGRENDQAEH